MNNDNNEKTLLTDLQLFANVNYYINLEYYHTLIFEQYQHYRRGSYSNRYYVAGTNGRLLLSVPLLHISGQQTAMKDVKICNRDRWQALHWKTLVSAYRRSPWFDFYEQELSVMYSKKYKFIIDWSLDAFYLVSSWLDRKWDVRMTDSYKMPGEIVGIKDGRNLFTPRPAESADGKRLFHYPQVFEEKNGFLPGLSILDLLFCEGKNAGKLLAGNGMS